MNRRLFPLALSLALLAGCAPAPEPTPEPTPTPAAAVDFHAFLDAVNEKRRAVIEGGSPWTSPPGLRTLPARTTPSPTGRCRL